MSGAITDQQRATFARILGVDERTIKVPGLKGPHTCPSGAAPDESEHARSNWYQALPGFWLPNGWEWTETDFPDYSASDYARFLDDPVTIPELIRLGPPSTEQRAAWGAWLGAWGCDTKLRRGWPMLEKIARVKYETARYKYLVPVWQRKITDAITALDNIEDQLSTILWVAEWVSRKVIPLPVKLMNAADKARRTFDCAEKVLAGVTPFRSRKAEYTNCLKKLKEARQEKQAQRAGLLAWFRDNWGRLLEAAQASQTWFDVGIVLGPIYGFLSEGAWGLAKSTTDNYLTAVDALMPGYKQSFYDTAQRIEQELQDSWDKTWGAISNWTEAGREQKDFMMPFM